MKKVKGYITNIDIDFNRINVTRAGSDVVESVPGMPTADVNLKLVEGDFSVLFDHMDANQPIEIVFGDEVATVSKLSKPKRRKESKWRMIEVD